MSPGKERVAKWKAGLSLEKKALVTTKNTEHNQNKCAAAKALVKRDSGGHQKSESVHTDGSNEVTITIAAARVGPVMATGVEVAGTDYFAVSNCKLSNPSGVGALLPKVVADICSKMVEIGEDTKMAALPLAASCTDTGSTSAVITYNKMKAFLPPHANKKPRCVMLFLLTQLSAYLGGKDRKEEFMSGQYGVVQTDSSKFSGLRLINGGRVEIFMNDKDRANGCFHALVKHMLLSQAVDTPGEICGKVLVQVTECLVEYCNYLARFDDRIAKADPPYVFQNHAIIASYDRAKAQDIHIDLDAPQQYQFGVLLTEDTPPTLEYNARLPVLGANTSLETIWEHMPKGLDKRLRAECPAVQEELDSYGCLLSDPVKVGRTSVAGVVPTADLFPSGTLLSLPGRVAHGGPPTESFRAVIFFTGAPVGVAPYDSDKQSNRTMLVGNMLVLCWMKMPPVQRVFLLKIWYEECLSKDVFGVYNLVHTHIKKLGHCLQSEKNAKQRVDLIKKFASHKWKKTNWEKGTRGPTMTAFQWPERYSDFV